MTEREYLEFTGFVVEIGTKTEAKSGARKVGIKKQLGDQFAKRFRCWDTVYDSETKQQTDEVSPTFDLLRIAADTGAVVSVRYYENYYQAGGETRHTNQIVDAWEGDGVSPRSPAAKSGTASDRGVPLDAPSGPVTLSDESVRAIALQVAAAMRHPAGAEAAPDAPEPDTAHVDEATLQDFLDQAQIAGYLPQSVTRKFEGLFGVPNLEDATVEQLHSVAAAQDWEWK